MKIIDINVMKPPNGEVAAFQGFDHGANVSFFVVQFSTGHGPSKHRHPYEETFIIFNGKIEVIVDGESQMIEGGTIAVIPANSWHEFKNRSDDPARMVTIHTVPKMVTEWAWHLFSEKGLHPHMSTSNLNPPIIELRVAVTTADYERLVKFYCDGLGLEPAAIWNNGQGQALILNMGSATLEIFDETQAQTIDQLEAGQRVSGQIRFALQVPELKAAMERLLAHGATLVHPPIITPWGDYNVRLEDPDGMQITLFQVLDKNEQGM